MKRLCLLPVLLLLLVGCQTTLTLTRTSRPKDFTEASIGCRSGINVVMLRDGAVVRARSVQFHADSIRWMLPDSTAGGVPLWAVQRVENIDRRRGAEEGRRIGFAVGLMMGGVAAGVGSAEVGRWNFAPFVLMAMTALVVGPMSGADEGAKRGSHFKIEVDSTASKR
jgi:hypothetical protein